MWRIAISKRAHPWLALCGDWILLTAIFCLVPRAPGKGAFAVFYLGFQGPRKGTLCRFPLLVRA
ncbi:hypothetical protein C5O22_07890 [Treponema sp. J25]|nr:hypothetical protein C5O22_07890 [Treponema sp. J25]